ncbi:hypothetical protein [Curtobacterium oceanosedimentum]|uniref:Uncharacterized protein n=1 Tax=Curtobacterium oceanosedimentum TaxID=465820 RepID=A0A147DTT6_9MICO|nr:hypothetical protein [Curtobacterium oceanosedimentum]KTR53559.1 hypothetical protein NS359_02895 [Curtobacterium oceanosedimentum]
MDRNLTISNTPIGTCTQTPHHIHSVEELQQLRIALRRAGRRGRQEFTCPMIRAWRRQFVDTYAVDATYIPSDASQSDKTELHRSRVLEADTDSLPPRTSSSSHRTTASARSGSCPSPSSAVP